MQLESLGLTGKQPAWTYSIDPTTVRVTAVDIPGSGKYAFCGTDSGLLYLFNSSQTGATAQWDDVEQLGGQVTAIDSSNDGSYVAVSWGRNVTVFRAVGKTLQFWWSPSDIPPYSNGGVSSIALSSDGKLLAVGTYVGTDPISNTYAYLFNVTSKQQVWGKAINSNILSGRTDKVTVDLSLDGRYLVAGSTYSYNVTIFDQAGNLTFPPCKTGGGVNGVSISENGDHLVAGSDKIYLFDKSGSDYLQTNRSLGASVTSVSIGHVLHEIAATAGNTVFLLRGTDSLWNYSSTGGISGALFSTNEEYIVARSGNYVFSFSRTLDGLPSTASAHEPIWTYLASAAVASVAVSADGTYTVAGSANCIYMFDTRANPDLTVRSLTPSSAVPIEGATFTISVEIMNIGNASANADLRIFDNQTVLASMTALPIAPLSQISRVVNATLFPSGLHIIWAVVDPDNLVHEFNESNNALGREVFVSSYSGEDLHINPTLSSIPRGTVGSVSSSGDGRYIAVGSNDGRVYLFARNREKPMKEMAIGDSAVIVSLSGNGKYVAAAHKEWLYVFTIALNNPIWSYPLPGSYTRSFFSLSFSSDGRMLAAGTKASTGSYSPANSSVYLFDVANASSPVKWCKVLTRGYSFTDEVSAKISADGGVIVAGSSYNTTKNVFLYRASGSLNSSFDTDSPVKTVAISEKGDQYIVGCADGSAYYFSRQYVAPRRSYRLVVSVSSLSMSGDGAWIVATNGTTVSLLNSSGTIWTYKAGRTISESAISVDGIYIAMRSYQNITVFLRSDYLNRFRFTYDCGDYDVGAMCLSSNGISFTAGCGSRILFFNVSRGINAAPLPVQNLRVPTGGVWSKSVMLSWQRQTADRDVDAYEVHVRKSINQVFSNVAVYRTANLSTYVSYEVKNLTPSTLYQFGVRAFDTEGAWSIFPTSNVSATTSAPYQPPQVTLNNPPEILSDSVQLSWNIYGGSFFNKYEVYISGSLIIVTSNGSLSSSRQLLTSLANITIETTTSWRASGLKPETPYYFTVRIVTTESASAYSLPKYATTASFVPHSVTLNPPGSITYDSVELSWTRNNDVDFSAYEIYYSKSPNPGIGSSVTPPVAYQGTTSTSVSGLAPNTRYYFRVDVLDKEGQRSGLSNEQSATTGPLPDHTLEIIGYAIGGVFVLGLVGVGIRKARKSRKTRKSVSAAPPPSRRYSPPSSQTKCSSCGFINRAGQKFCGKCGAALTEEEDTKIY